MQDNLLCKKKTLQNNEKKLLKLRTLTKSVLINSENTYEINVKLVDGFFKMIYLLTRAVFLSYLR